LRSHVTRDRRAGTAAEIEDARAFGQHCHKAIVPGLVIPSAVGAVGIPRRSVPLVVANNQIRQTVHYR
jgi:hypothetical protein